MYTIKISTWKNNKYGDPDEVRYFGKYLTEKAANIDAKEINDRIYYSAIYVRVKINIIKEEVSE